MNFQEFVEAVRKEVVLVIREEKGEMVENTENWNTENILVKVHKNLKNNGKELVGLIIRDKSINVAPVIYLEEFFAELSTAYTIHDMAYRIVKEYKRIRFHSSWNIEGFCDYNCIKKQIACKLINFEKNEELLEDTPYVKYMDLAIVFYVLVEETEKGSATMLVKEMHKEAWKVEVTTMFQQALENMESLLPAKFQTMTSVISEIIDVNTREDEEERMYVLSNTKRNFGAACILYPEKLKEIGKYLKQDYYILPSSIHEVIIVPDGEFCLSKKELEKMVHDVNIIQVAEEEVLSNTVYYYKREEERLLY